MSFTTTMRSFFKRGAPEGACRPGPWYLPNSGGWLSAENGQFWNWWQMGASIEGASRSAIVQACISR
jgi:hypothetical protein